VELRLRESGWRISNRQAYEAWKVSEIRGEFRRVKSVGNDDARSVLGIIEDPTEVLAYDTDEDESEAVEK
jgi:hypothetical protein